MAVDPARAKLLFLAASDLADPAARAAYLDGACGDDAALRQRVEALLAAHDGAGQPVEGDATRMSEPTAPASPDTIPASDPKTHLASELVTREHGADGEGSTVAGDPQADCPAGFVAGQVIAGRYTLLGVLGEGGMGTVYRADQTAPVKRQVALKLIKIGMDSRVVLARFDAERQALALMDHPNIARVYDGGTTAAGQPFFVMELVSGEPITDYCDRLRMPVRARLELFVAVCQAVQHAHQKGIIHRDLKPSNVMVTEVDGRPTPKVIDFGVATATEFKLTDQSFGDIGTIVGTPTYMSPEQADPLSMDIDTRTDVYALGVILYELLAGSPPIDSKEFRRGAILEMLRLVREVVPPRPSTKVSTADALPSIAASRDVEPAHLKRALRGDLDWIVMMALEKDRSRRYATANGFAADIQRHLAHEPVVAAPPSRGYRMGKFIRKHRGAVVAASLVLLALLAGMAGTTWGLFEAKRHETAANYYADAARGQAAVARDNAKRADAEARSARRAEQEARDRATAEAAAKVFAQRETLRAEAEKERTADQLTRAEWLLYAGKIAQSQNDFEAGNGGLALHYLDQCQVSLRGWEHRYLWTRINARQTLVGHAGSVSSVAISPDSKRIVTGSDDATAKVWDAETGQELLTLKGHTHKVWSVAISPDGRRIVTSSDDATAKVWDAETGQELLNLKGHTYRVLSVAFSPDGKRIVTGSSAPYVPGEAKVWDAETGQELLNLKGHKIEVWCVAFSPDGKRIVIGGNHHAKVWDAQTGQEVLALEEHPAVKSVAFSPDGKRIVTSSEYGTVKVWDAETGRLVLALEAHKAWVHSVAFSPDGKRFVTGSEDHTAKVWDAATGKELLALKGHAGIVRGVAFSPDGKRIVTGSEDRTAKAWDAEMGQQVPTLRGHMDFINSIAFSPDGKRIVTGSGDNTARIWNTATGQELLAVKLHTTAPNTNWTLAAAWSVAFSPDGKRIVTGGQDHAAKVWVAATGQELLALKGHTAAVRSVAFSPDGTRIVTGAGEWGAPGPGELKVWDAATGHELRALKGHTNQLLSVAFSPDGKRIVTGSQDHAAKVWDAATGQELLALKGHADNVNSVAFSPDGKRIVTGSSDATAKVWDAETGQELLTLKGHTALVSSVAFSPDGQRIASGSGDWTVKLWEAATGQEVLSLKEHTNGVWSVAFSPDGKHLVSGIAGIHATVKVWSAEKGQDVLVLEGHTDLVTSVAFSGDGQRIFAWDAQKDVLAWSSADGKRIDPVDPPPMPPPGPARSPDGFRRAVPEGKTIAVTDRRPSRKENAWPLPDAAGRNDCQSPRAEVGALSVRARNPNH